MLIDVNKLAINRLLQGLTLEEYDDKDPYIYKARTIDSSGSWYSITKNGYWSKVNKNNGISVNNNIITQFNFISTEINYISDLFILVDYSKDSDRFLIYRNTNFRYYLLSLLYIYMDLYHHILQELILEEVYLLLIYLHLSTSLAPKIRSQDVFETKPL
jgi:hypothetical protein